MPRPSIMVLVLPFFHCWFLYRPCPATHQNPLRSSRFIVLLCAASSPLRNSREGSPLIPSHQTPEYPLVTRCLALVTLGELCPLEPLVETQAGIVGGCGEQDTVDVPKGPTLGRWMRLYRPPFTGVLLAWPSSQNSGGCIIVCPLQHKDWERTSVS